MKVRSIKHRFFNLFPARAVQTAAAVAKIVTFQYPVLRKKDGVQVAVVASVEAAQVLIDKAKAAKKASLEIGAPIAF